MSQIVPCASDEIKEQDIEKVPFLGESTGHELKAGNDSIFRRWKFGLWALAATAILLALILFTNVIKIRTCSADRKRPLVNTPFSHSPDEIHEPNDVAPRKLVNGSHFRTTYGSYKREAFQSKS